MFILFGWGFRTKKFFKQKHRRCHICTGEIFSLFRVTTWFTLFFIPIIPYSTKYYMVCHNCGNSIELSKDQFFQEINEPEIREEEKSQFVEAEVEEEDDDERR